MLLNNGKKIALAPQGLAELTPQLVQGYYYPQAIGLELERKFAIFSEMYSSQPWIYICVNKRANAIARLPIGVWNESGPTREQDTSSGYAKLLADPCPYLDPFRFYFWLQATRDIYGETYCAIIKDRSTGKPVALLPMHPTRVALKRDEYTGNYTYTFQAGAGYGDGLVQFAADEVVPFLEYNPLKLERGMSRLEPLRSTIMSEDSSRNAQSASWHNGGRPSVVLSTDKRLGDEGRKRLKESFQATHSGSSQAGQTLVLEDGLKATALQLTAVEMQMIESRQLNREEICAAFDVAPTVVHILEHATFSNISAQLRAFYRDTMAPPIESLESTLDYYVGQYWQGSKVARFAVDEVIRGDFETRAEAARALATVGGLTPNEVRELMGYSPFDGRHAERAQELYANAAMQVLGEPAERITLTGPVGHDPDGVALDLSSQGVPTTRVPAGGDSSTDSGIDVPQLTDSSAPSAMSNLPEAQVASLDYSSRPLRELKGGLGRGQPVRELALKLAEKYPDHLQEILAAVQIAIADRNRVA